MWKTGFGFRVNDMQPRTAAVHDNHPCMAALQLARMLHPAGMCYHTHIVPHIFHIMRYAHRFVLRNKATLQTFLMRGNSGRAGVFMALHGLKTKQRRLREGFPEGLGLRAGRASP